MPDLLVLINGLPGAGKTTLAHPLAAALDAVVISKDAIKESVADRLGLDPASSPALGAAAMDMAWALAAAVPGTAVVESWWFPPRDLRYAEAGVRRCGTPPVVEVWCALDPEVARRRVEARERHPVHTDATSLADHWASWSRGAAPLGIGRTVRVDTSRPVDVAAVAREVRRV